MKRSFTLVETVIAMTLLLTISAAVFTTYFGAVSVMRELGVVNYEERALDRVASRIHLDLSSISYLEKLSKEFKGFSKRISFPVLEQRYSYDNGEKYLGHTYLTYYLSRNRLKRKQLYITDFGKISIKQNDELILGQSTDLDFRYAYWDSSKKTYNWKRRTSSVRTIEDLPDLIEFILRFNLEDKILERKSVVNIKKVKP